MSPEAEPAPPGRGADQPRWVYPVAMSRPRPWGRAPTVRWQPEPRTQHAAPVRGPAPYEPSTAWLNAHRAKPEWRRAPTTAPTPFARAERRRPYQPPPDDSTPQADGWVDRPFDIGGWGRRPPPPCTRLPTKARYLASDCCRRDECTDTTDTFRGALPGGTRGTITMNYPLRAAGWRGLRVNDCAGACKDPTAAGDGRFTVDGDTLIRPSPNKWPVQT